MRFEREFPCTKSFVIWCLSAPVKLNWCDLSALSTEAGFGTLVSQMEVSVGSVTKGTPVRAAQSQDLGGQRGPGSMTGHPIG